MALFYTRFPFIRRRKPKSYPTDWMPSEIFREFAATRSHADATASNETGKSTAQSIILINGGASTALLAYLARGDLTPRGHVFGIALCLVGYALGMFFGGGMLILRLHALDEAGLYWRYVAFPEVGESSEKHQLKSRRLSFWGEWFLTLSMVFFFVSSIGVAWLVIIYIALCQ